MSGPLTGVRVLALAGMGSAPFACMLLADMGADVVSVARPPSNPALKSGQVEGLAAEHDLANRGVRVIPFDMKGEAGPEPILSLMAQADIFIEGFRPGAVERLGIGPDVALERNPRLVYARLTGYGQAGPLSRRAGHDINYVAQSGALHAMARFGEAPHPPINLMGDYAGGGTVAAFGIVCALFEARESGRGQVVDAAMVDGVALLTAKIQGLRAAGRYSDVPGTNWLDTGAPFYDTYRCSDGRFLAVGALEEVFYRKFLDGFGVDTSDWPDQNDQASWPHLRELIAAVIASKPRDEWVQVYAGVDACVSPVLNFEEAARDPHNSERQLFKRVGGVLHPSPAPRFSTTTAREPEAPASCAELRLKDIADQWGATIPNPA